MSEVNLTGANRTIACPHVAGVAAYLITLEGLSSPGAVYNRLTALGTTGHVTDPMGSPNVIVYNGNGA
jgi:oryzin